MISELKQMLDLYLYSANDSAELARLVVNMLSGGVDKDEIIHEMISFIETHELNESAEKELYDLIAAMDGDGHLYYMLPSSLSEYFLTGEYEVFRTRTF
jgi:hypothetical protein